MAMAFTARPYLLRSDEENIASLKDYEYFTVMRANGEQQKIGEVTDFLQIWSNNKLTLHLQVPLEKPIDPKKDEFVFKVYDPEFYHCH